MTEQTYTVAAGEITSFIERVERLEQEKKETAEQIKEVLADAKGRGYDTAALRKIVAMRRKSPEDIAEEEAILAMYKDALGMA